MPTAAEVAKLQALAANKAAFNGQIKAFDGATALVNGLVASGKYPELIGLQNGATAAVAGLNKYSALLTAAIKQAGGLPPDAPLPLGARIVRTDAFHPGIDGIMAALRAWQPQDDLLVNPGVYKLDVAIAAGKVTPITINVDVPFTTAAVPK